MRIKYSNAELKPIVCNWDARHWHFVHTAGITTKSSRNTILLSAAGDGGGAGGGGEHKATGCRCWTPAACLHREFWQPWGKCAQPPSGLRGAALKNSYVDAWGSMTQVWQRLVSRLASWELSSQKANCYNEMHRSGNQKGDVIFLQGHKYCCSVWGGLPSSVSVYTDLSSGQEGS